MKVLVTGGAGFIGSHTVDLLLEEGHKVSVIDDLSNGKLENLDKRVSFHRADITENNLNAIFKKEKPVAIIHLAAQINLRKSFENPVFDAKVNILGTMNILEMSAKYGIRKIVYSSSAAVYGSPKYLPIDEKHPANPESPYGLSKYAAERFILSFCRKNEMDYTILRYGNVYGPRQDPLGEAGVISIFIEKLLKRENPEIFGDGNQTRDFVFVKDVALANLFALKQGKNEIFNVGSGKETSINQIFENVQKLTGTKFYPVHTEPKKEVRRMAFEISKIKKEGWKPKTMLEDGLKETVNFFRK